MDFTIVYDKHGGWYVTTKEEKAHDGM